MTTEQHPITPPPELMEQWRDRWIDDAAEDNTQDLGIRPSFMVHIATQASRWGADQELHALLAWLRVHHYDNLASDLLAARRPKPPSLVEQALEAHERMWIGGTTDADWALIRVALERLQELENNG